MKKIYYLVFIIMFGIANVQAWSLQPAILSSGFHSTFGTVQLQSTFGEPIVGFLAQPSFRLTQAFEQVSCALTSVSNEIEDFGQVRVYPNPAKDKLQIEADFQFNQIVIYNLLGQKTKSYQTENSRKVEISLSDLSAGTYIISVQNSGSISKNLKFTKID